MDRRNFLLTGACLTAGTFLHRAVRGAERLTGKAPPTVDRIAVASTRPCGQGFRSDAAAGLRRAVEELGGAKLLGRRGEHVIVKPTLSWNRTPEEGANVHPEVLRSAVEIALEGGAARVTIFDRTSMPSYTVYRVSGAAQVIAAMDDPRVELVHLRDEDFVPLVPESGSSSRARRPESLPPATARAFEALGATLARFRVCRYLLDADRVVNIATVRHHPTRRASLGLANLLGMIGGWPMGSTWGARHDAELALLGAAIRPDLTILDGTRVVFRNGPDGRGRNDVDRRDLLSVSRDPIGIESHGVGWLNLRHDNLPHLDLAARLGVGKVEACSRLIEV